MEEGNTEEDYTKVMNTSLVERTKTFSHTCLKLALVLPQKNALTGQVKLELVQHSSKLAIQARTLMSGQVGEQFLVNLNECVVAANGCYFWLEYILAEKMLQDELIKPLADECVGILKILQEAFKNAKSRMD